MSLRTTLKLINRYVRDPEMSRVLRTNFLTQARNKQYTQDSWGKTEKVLKQCFGVGGDIDGFTLQILETYKQVESNKVFEKNTSPFN